jgi:hypothetical protein
LVVQQVEHTVQQLTSRGVLEAVERGRTTLYRLRRPDSEQSALPVESKN